MAIYYNGTEVPSTSNIYYNGTKVSLVCANGQVVWPDNQTLTFRSSKTGTSCHFYTDNAYNPYICDFRLTWTMSGSNGVTSGAYRDSGHYYRNGMCAGINWADCAFPQNNDKQFCWGFDQRPYDIYKDITLVSKISCIGPITGCVFTTVTDSDGYDTETASRHWNYTWTGSCIITVPTTTGCPKPDGYPYCGGYVWTPMFMQGLGVKVLYCDGTFPTNCVCSAEMCHVDTGGSWPVCVCWGLAWTSPTGERKYCWLWRNRGQDQNWSITCQVTLS